MTLSPETPADVFIRNQANHYCCTRSSKTGVFYSRFGHGDANTLSPLVRGPSLFSCAESESQMHDSNCDSSLPTALQLSGVMSST
jgi:hypothetical protein